MDVRQAHCGHWIKVDAVTDLFHPYEVAVHTETGMRTETRRDAIYLCDECAKKLRK